MFARHIWMFGNMTGRRTPRAARKGQGDLKKTMDTVGTSRALLSREQSGETWRGNSETKGRPNRRLTLIVGTKRAKCKIQGQADLDSGHINWAIGNCDEEGEQVLAGRLVQGKVALMLAHHHHKHLPAYHHCSLRHCNSLIIKFYLLSYCCACSKNNCHCCQVSRDSVLMTDARSPSACSQHLSQFRQQGTSL